MHAGANADPRPEPGEWPGGSARFVTTQWTVISAARGDGERRDAALANFCRAYWYPLYAFLRRRGSPAEDARDLVQGFFLQMIEKDWLSGVERRETRFSTFLITIFERFLTSEYRKTSAAKRGGGCIIHIDLAEAEEWLGSEPCALETPDQLFERRLALAVLDRALCRLRDESRSAGRSRIFESLSPFLSREPVRGEYESIATTLGLTRRAVAVAVHRLRREFRDSVRAEVAAGLIDTARVDDEMRHLASSLQSS